MEREVFYPPVGIAHVTKNLIDLILYKYKGQKKIIINTSAQPNSSPHLGTITTLMTAFALASKIRDDLKVDTEIQFDELENSPSEIIEYEGEIYYRDQRHSFYNKKSKEEINMNRFNKILKKLSDISNIPCVIRSYNEFQNNKYVRQALINIINEKEYFKELLFPSASDLHIRTICPTCGLGKKTIKQLEERHNNNEIILKGYCPVHGSYEIRVTEKNTEYVDINTQFRDLTKGVAMLEEDKKNNTLTIMLDGGDWSGIWAQRMHTEGLVKLGYTEFPIRIFAPIILDWSGAKFSKSLYLKNDAYKNINSAFINYDNFIEYYGEKGREKLWKEVKSWIDEPKKFFRNYSIDYFQMLMEGKNYE